MPKLVRLYIRHSIIGFALSGVFVAALMYFNVANLWHLVTHAPSGWLALVLLVLFNGIVFSGVQFGIAVMALARPDEGDGGHRRHRPSLDGPSHDRAAALAPIPVPVRDPRPTRR